MTTLAHQQKWSLALEVLKEMIAEEPPRQKDLTCCEKSKKIDLTADFQCLTRVGAALIATLATLHQDLDPKQTMQGIVSKVVGNRDRTAPDCLMDSE